MMHKNLLIIGLIAIVLLSVLVGIALKVTSKTNLRTVTTVATVPVSPAQMTLRNATSYLHTIGFNITYLANTTSNFKNAPGEGLGLVDSYSGTLALNRSNFVLMHILYYQNSTAALSAYNYIIANPSNGYNTSVIKRLPNGIIALSTPIGASHPVYYSLVAENGNTVLVSVTVNITNGTSFLLNMLNVTGLNK